MNIEIPQTEFLSSDDLLRIIGITKRLLYTMRKRQLKFPRKKMRKENLVNLTLSSYNESKINTANTSLRVSVNGRRKG